MWIPLVFPSIMLAKPKGNESTGHALFFLLKIPFVISYSSLKQIIPFIVSPLISPINTPRE